MKYRDLNIQTQREAPNNARSEGFSFLVRAGYLTRENVPTQLGEYTLNHLRALSSNPSFLDEFCLPVIGNENETFFPMASGPIEVAHCPVLQIHRTSRIGAFCKDGVTRGRMNAHLKKYGHPIVIPSKHWQIF